MPQSTQLSLQSPSTGTAELQSALNSFKTSLTDQQRQELGALSAQPNAAAVVQFTTLLDENNAARRSRCIAARVHTVLACIQQFSTVVDTFVSSNPNIAALLWGSIKLTLLLVSDFASYFDKLSTLLMQFGRHCPRFDEYQKLYLDSTRLQSKLSSFYSTLVSCCTTAVQAIQRTGLTHLAQTLLSSFNSDFGHYEQRLRHCSKEIKAEIDLADKRAADKERLAQAAERDGAQRHRLQELLHRARVEKSIEKTNDHILQIEKTRALQQKRNLLEKLSSFDHTRSLKRAQKQRIGLTGKWLSKTREFQDWIADTTSSLLLLSGKLGSGKTILTAGAIAELCQKDTFANNTAYFFCQFDNEASLRATTILRSLLKQILNPETLSEKQQSCLETIGRGHGEMEDLEYLLESAISTSRNHFFIIDAIDECSEFEKRLLLKALRTVMEFPNRKVKLFLSSRDRNDRRVRNTCEVMHQVSTGSQDSETELEQIVSSRLDNLVEEGELQVGSPCLLREIKDHLLSEADGMILWVDFQLQDICSRESDYDIRVALQHLPKGLPETYDRLLGQIHTSGKDELVQKVFSWVACAKSPLSLEQLREAIAIKPLQKSSEPDRQINDILRIPSWCRGLATCDEEDGALQFAHSTIKNFLVGKPRNQAHTDFHLDLKETDHYLGEICVTYLSFSDFETQVVKFSEHKAPVRGTDILSATVRTASGPKISDTISLVSKLSRKFGNNKNRTAADFPWSLGASVVDTSPNSFGSHPFLHYASIYWTFHTRHFSKETTSTWRLWNRLLQTESDIIRTEWTLEQLSNRDEIIERFLEEQQHHGLLEWIEASERRLDQAQADRILSRCASQGLSETVAKVISMCDTSPRQRSYVLQEAAREGHLQMVERLLDAEADVNAADVATHHGRTALQTAAERGHLHVVERLLDVGADVNAAAEAHHGRTPLQAAAGGGHLQVVERLLNAGANANAEAPWEGRTALQAAAAGGHLQVVERLLNAMADVNLGNRFKQTALYYAAEGGHLQVAERLINAKADINVRDKFERTALHKAAEGGHLQVVQMLLDAKANVNEKGPNGRTALYVAYQKGHLQVVKMLLQNGAVGAFIPKSILNNL